MSKDVQFAWFAFDYQVAGGARVVDKFLRQAVLTAGERNYLMAMRESSMRLYQVQERCRPRSPSDEHLQNPH